MAQLFRCGGGSGNPYLRFDTESGYIQVKDTDGDWIDLHATDKVPIDAFDGYVYQGGKWAKGYGLGTTIKYGGSIAGSIKDTGAFIQMQNTGYNDGTGQGNILPKAVNMTPYSTLHISYRRGSTTGSILTGTIDVSTLSGDYCIGVATKMGTDAYYDRRLNIFTSATATAYSTTSAVKNLTLARDAGNATWYIESIYLD